MSEKHNSLKLSTMGFSLVSHGRGYLPPVTAIRQRAFERFCKYMFLAPESLVAPLAIHVIKKRVLFKDTQRVSRTVTTWSYGHFNHETSCNVASSLCLIISSLQRIPDGASTHAGVPTPTRKCHCLDPSELAGEGPV